MSRDTGRLLRCLAVSIGVVCLGVILADNPIVTTVEKYLDDGWYRLEPQRPVDDRIVVIEIDDATLEYYFPEIPLPRDQIALLLDELAGPAGNARTIVLDLYFEGPDRSDPGADTLLAYVLESHWGKIVSSLYFPDVEAAENGEALAEATSLQSFCYNLPGMNPPVAAPINLPLELLIESTASYGHIDVYQDETGVPREIPLFIKYGDCTIGALAVEAVRNFIGVERREVQFDVDRLIIADHAVPINDRGSMKMRHSNASGGYAQFGMLDLLQRFADGTVEPETFRDKIVLIGINSKTYYPKEYSQTPFGGERPNVYVHADLVSGILDDLYLSDLPRLLLWWLAGVLGLAFVLVHMLTTRASRLLISVLLILSIIVSDMLLFRQGLLFEAVPLLLIAVGLATYTYFVSFAEQADIIKVQERETLSLRKKEQSLVEIEHEITVARAIQDHLLPQTAPVLAGYEICGMNLAAKGVSGDFFDYTSLSNGSLAISVADVSGKGIAAALLMAASQAILRSESLVSGTIAPSSAAIIAATNSLVYAITEPSRFVTMFYAILDSSNHRLSYVNAGHNSPIWVRSDGSTEFLETGGIILGILPEVSYEAQSLDLDPGEKIVVFTDGVVEAANDAGKMYGDDRIVNLIENNHARPPEQLMNLIVDDVKMFAGSADQADDITIVVIGRN